jgi:hypothetical protein
MWKSKIQLVWRYGIIYVILYLINFGNFLGKKDQDENKLDGY